MPDSARLTRLLRPRHIAAIGGRHAEEVVRQCQRIGFQGPLWPVHPTRETMQGLHCHASAGELPEAPDAAFIGVAREATVDVVAELARLGCGGAVVLASGFAELDAVGEQLQHALIEAAGDMPLVGPNCYGLLNYLDGAALWPDQHGGERAQSGVAIITQSGNIGVTLTMQQRSLPLAYVVSIGNQAVLNVGDYIEAFVDDPRVTAIGLHLEGVKDIGHFAQACAHALRHRKPVVAMKSGRSAQAAQAALSHTSSLTGTDDLYAALFKRYGVARVAGLSTFVETLKLLHMHGALPGNRIASMSCSGGEAGLVADLAHDLDLQLPPFPAVQTRALQEVLGERVAVHNPLDYHTYIWANEQALTDCYAAVLASDTDVAMLVCDYPHPDNCDHRDWLSAERAFMSAHRRAGNRPIIVATLPENFPRATRERFVAAGIAPMQGLDECLSAIRAAAFIGAAQVGEPAPASLGTSGVHGKAVRLFDEHTAKTVLQKAGISVPEGHRTDAAGAVEAARSLGFPVVVKALIDDLAHKTELGAVRLNLCDARAVVDAVAQLGALSQTFLVERMIEDSVAEMLVGIVSDVQFGPVLSLGAGGILVEMLADHATLLLPTSGEEIERALRGLKTFPLLDAFRGAPPADREALVATVLKIADYAMQHRDTLLELEINPLLVRPRGRGVVAADVLLRCTAPK